jgi:hypothetical protein
MIYAILSKLFNLFRLGLLVGGKPICFLIILAICILIYPDPVLPELLFYDGGSGGLNSKYICSIVDPSVNVSGLGTEATSTATSSTGQVGQATKLPTEALLSRRGLPPMSVNMPSGGNLNSGPATQIKNFIQSAEQSIKLYEEQGIKFRKHISDIKNGSEL